MRISLIICAVKTIDKSDHVKIVCRFSEMNLDKFEFNKGALLKLSKSAC